jgi:endo-1,4-beta-xylanase
LSLIDRRFAAHWKLPLISGAVLVVGGLAIGLPASMAGSHRTAGSVTTPVHAKHNLSGVFAGAEANTAAGGRLARRSPGCLVTYSPSNWPGAFTVKVTIDNRGATSINGWKLTFAFPGDQAISSAWNAGFTQTGARVSATNTNYDATIAPRARQSLGFLGTWTSNDTAPTSFRVNGAACR